MQVNTYRIVLDFCVLLLVSAPSFFFKFYGSNIVFKRGFFCDDQDLRYPKKEETYNGKVVWAITFIVPCSTIILNEMYIYYKKKQLSNLKLVKIFLFDIYKKILIYTFGLLSLNLFANLFKYSIGRLRPHFFDSCKPVDPITGNSLSNCSNLEDKFKYIENYVCLGQIENNLFLSFFSGHACLMSYQFVYFLFYTQNNMQLRIFGLIRPMLQVIHLILSAYIVLSRVFDYYHHPSDLVFGSFVGTAAGIITYYFLGEYTESYWFKSSQFLYHHACDHDDELPDSNELFDTDSEVLKIKQKVLGNQLGIDVIDKGKLRKTSNLVKIDERTALLSSEKSNRSC